MLEVTLSCPKEPPRHTARAQPAGREGSIPSSLLVFTLPSGGHVTEKGIGVRQNQLGSKSPVLTYTLKDSKAFVARASGCLILFT